MGEEQIFANAFDFFDIAIALSKGGYRALSKLPNPVAVLDRIPAVKELVERLDKTSLLRIFARRNINKKIKGYCKNIVSDMQLFKKSVNIAENTIDSTTINRLIDKYKNYPQVTALQTDYLYEKQINPNSLIKENILNHFLSTDYAKEVRFADSLNLTNDIKPFNMIYMDCVKSSRENMMKQVEDQISSLKHQANMEGTAIDESVMKKLTDELKVHRDIIKKIDKKIINCEEALRPKPYIPSEQPAVLNEPITKVKAVTERAGNIIPIGEKVKPTEKLRVASVNANAKNKPQIVKQPKLKL